MSVAGNHVVSWVVWFFSSGMGDLVWGSYCIEERKKESLAVLACLLLFCKARQDR
jgi:hypothetical protein